MWTYVIRRLGVAAVTVLVTVVATFIMIRLAPGDPVYMLIGEYASEAELAEARVDFGLDRPIWEQLVIYLWRALRLDFGDSISQGIPAYQLITTRVPATILLALVTMAIIIAVSVIVGTRAAMKEGSAFDRTVGGAGFIALSLPDFWVGIVFILVFARWLHLLPSAGSGSVTAIIMPAVTLALSGIAINTRLIRNETLSVLKAPYIVLARARGLPDRIIFRRHVLRNAMIPVLTVAGVQFGSLLGGTAIVETVFAWPGLGELLVRSIGNRDYPVVQACIIVATAFVVLSNLAVDIAYRYVDPRFRS